MDEIGRNQINDPLLATRENPIDYFNHFVHRLICNRFPTDRVALFESQQTIYAEVVKSNR